MNKNTKKKTDKQIYTKFAILMVVSLAGGFFLGVGGSFLMDFFNGNLLAGLKQMMQVGVPVVYVGFMLIAYGYGFTNYFKAKKLVAEWDGWSEEVADEAEKKLGNALSAVNVMSVCNFFLYTAMMYVAAINEAGAKERIPIAIAAVGVFALNTVILIVLQKMVVDLTKKLNPEKKGNIFDTKFNKEWIASCDEAQKQLVYESAYKAYQVTIQVCQVMWVVTFFAMMFFDTGLLPSFCVFVLWLTMVLSYTIACKKLENRK